MSATQPRHSLPPLLPIIRPLGRLTYDDSLPSNKPLLFRSELRKDLFRLGSGFSTKKYLHFVFTESSHNMPYEIDQILVVELLVLGQGLGVDVTFA